MSGSGDVNDSMSCAALNIQGPVELPLPFLLPLITRCLLVIYYMMVTFFGTVFNSVVLFVVCKHKKLRTLSFAYAIQIVISNIIGCVTTLPIALVSAIYNQFLFGEHMCLISGSLYYDFAILRVGLFLGLVTDRFCSVFMTYSYPKYRVKVVCVTTAVIYIVTAVASVFAAVFDCYTFSATSWICRIATTCSPQCHGIRVLIGVILVIPWSVAPVVMYIALFYKGWKARKTMPVAASDLTGEQKKTKREWRATITFFLMFCSLFLVTTPPGILSGIANGVSISSDSEWFYIVDALTLNMFFLSYIVDPFFILRNRDVREVVSEITWIPKILCC